MLLRHPRYRLGGVAVALNARYPQWGGVQDPLKFNGRGLPRIISEVSATTEKNYQKHSRRCERRLRRKRTHPSLSVSSETTITLESGVGRQEHFAFCVQRFFRVAHLIFAVFFSCFFFLFFLVNKKWKPKTCREPDLPSPDSREKILPAANC